jgi:hypothetical protein
MYEPLARVTRFTDGVKPGCAWLRQRYLRRAVQSRAYGGDNDPFVITVVDMSLQTSRCLTL